MTGRAAILAAVVVLAACTPGAREAAPFEGRWEADGFGTFMVIEGGTVEFFEHTAVSCVRVQDGAARGISDVLSFEGERLVLDDDRRLIRFDRIDFLPERCADEFFTGDPGLTLDVLDATFRDHYLPGVDEGWDERVEAARSSSPEELHAAVLEVLGPLADPEVRLAADGVDDPSWAAAEPAVAVRSALPGAVTEAGSGLLTARFGDVSYLGITSLAALGPRQETELGVALDRELSAAADALVLDLRMASGGLDRVARLVASRLVPTMSTIGERFVGTVSAGEVTVTPLPTGTYAGRVVVLVGPGTSGSGEILAAALLVVPGVVVAGEPTAGRPGQPLVRVLPTGWSVGVPHQALVLPDGTVVGPEGLQPDVPVESGDTGDPQLDAALGLASD